LECNYRFPQPNAIEMSALLLLSLRGQYDESRDTDEKIASFVEDVVPRYLLLDRTDVNHTRPEDVIAAAEAGSQSHESAMQCVAAGATCGSRWANSVVYRRVGCVDAEGEGAGDGAAAMALTREKATTLLKAEYADLAGTTRFDAQKKFVQKVKEFVAFGSDIYVGKRTWRANDADATEDEVMERTEDVTVCVAYSGIVFTGLTHPLGCEEHKFDSITKWTLSEDNRVFAFQVEEPEPTGQGVFKFVVYIVTEQAPDVMQSVDRFVTALVDHSQDKLAESRDKSDTPDVPTEVTMVAAPVPDCAAGAGWGAAAGGSAPTGEAAAAAAASATSATSIADPDPAASPEEDSSTPGTPGAASAASDELPAGWEARTDDDGDVYYYNTETEVTQWERPAASSATSEAGADELPAGWEARTDDDGDVYYYNTETDATQWERPIGESAPTSPVAHDNAEAADEEPLPDGWEKLLDPDGDAYFYHAETEATQWERPTA
jgi:hypothetical protein